MLSKSEVAQLGDSLRWGGITREQLALLEEYRRTFQPAIGEVVERISAHLSQLDVESSFVQRPSKATPSIVAKLRRQPTLKLTQIQDIAGLRMRVSDRYWQDQTVSWLGEVFPDAKMIDRRQEPSHGYRAVHVIVRAKERKVEIQIRTYLQDFWAQVTERLADAKGHEIKYGAGDAGIQQKLMSFSKRIDAWEASNFGPRIETAEGAVERTEIMSDLSMLLQRELHGGTLN